jgi:hypothetical protein
MILNKVKLHIKIIEIDDTYNFVVELFYLRLFNSPKNYYKLSNSQDYIVSHTTQVIL